MMLRRRVSRDEPKQIAREHAEAQGWPWTDPVVVSREFRAWRVVTNAAMRGGNVSVWIDASSGDVRRGGFAPR